MTTEDPRPEPEAPDDSTVSSVAESGAAETAPVAETDTAAAEIDTAAAAVTTAGAATVAAAAATPSPTPPAAPPAPPVGWEPPPPSGGSNAYPINVRFDRDQRIGRVWAIPIVGWFLRWVVLIPHFILLWAFGIVVFFAILVTWIPVLLTGRFPNWGYEIIGGFYRWYIRVFAYLLLMVGPYPPFSPTAPYPVEVDFDRDTRLNQLWGIPLLGLYVRALLAIPHLIILWFLGIAVYLIVFVAWIPVLVNGRYPQIGYDIVGGFVRWYTRVSGWILMMAGPYPPFRLDE